MRQFKSGAKNSVPIHRFISSTKIIIGKKSGVHSAHSGAHEHQHIDSFREKIAKNEMKKKQEKSAKEENGK